jgi:large subunit ribosomal protein L13
MKAKTYSQKPADVTRVWHVVDASEVPLGRLATQVATLLTGKYKPTFTPHTDGGDYVIVINAAQLVVTGDKAEKKKYYRHTGFPGGIKETTLEKKDPASVITAAVRGMITANKLRPDRLARLKIYNDDQHNHHAQKPVAYSLKGTK